MIFDQGVTSASFWRKKENAVSSKMIVWQTALLAKMLPGGGGGGGEGGGRSYLFMKYDVSGKYMCFKGIECIIFH